MALVETNIDLQPINVDFDDQHPGKGDSRKELLSGLAEQQKTINPKYLYDETGSELFDRITQLPEYYPTRTETSILNQYADDIAKYCGSGCVLIEPGSGSSEKVRLILDAIKPSAYVPLDISAEFLFRSANRLGQQYPWLAVHAICADFSHDWCLPSQIPEGKRVVFYPGSTIGNLEPEAAIAFLSRLKHWINSDGGILLGVDLHKSEAVLNAAYNDSEGVTAAFNLNLLEHVNRLLDAEFESEHFTHRAHYNTKDRRIEMHLVSEKIQRVRCNGNHVEFAQNETIHTENSYKYTMESFSQLVEQAGCCIKKSWVDDKKLFSVHYLQPVN